MASATVTASTSTSTSTTDAVRLRDTLARQHYWLWWHRRTLGCDGARSPGYRQAPEWAFWARGEVARWLESARGVARRDWVEVVRVRGASDAHRQPSVTPLAER
jgi:hypothetical protein